MPVRPYVLLSTAASLDGYIDDDSDSRLLLSNESDFDRVDELRAGVDAILVGANTVRRDDPRLVLRSADRARRRVAAGLPEGPSKVTVTDTGELDPDAAFFTVGGVEKLVYTSTGGHRAARARFGDRATVVSIADTIDPGVLLADLARRGVHRLMVEGGAGVQASLLAAHLVDELHLVYAPFFVGARGHVSLADHAWFVAGHPAMTLAEVRTMGNHVLLRYLLEAGS